MHGSSVFAKTEWFRFFTLYIAKLTLPIRAKGTIPAVMNNRIANAVNGPAVEMTIAQARAVSSGNAILTGTVTVINGSNVFFQENINGNVAGICLYNSKGAVVHKGDTIKATGSLSLYNGLLEITPKAATDVRILSTGNTVTPKVVTVDESVEGQVVKLKGVTIDNIDPTGTSMIHDATGSIAIYKIPAVELNGKSAA